MFHFAGKQQQQQQQLFAASDVLFVNEWRATPRVG